MKIFPRGLDIGSHINATHQVRRAAGARYERTLFAVTWMPGVDMTSDVKSGLLIFFHLLYPVDLRHRKRRSQ
jgi:hypothetical protein